jgi:hypothetical protein
LTVAVGWVLLSKTAEGETTSSGLFKSALVTPQSYSFLSEELVEDLVLSKTKKPIWSPYCSCPPEKVKSR